MPLLRKSVTRECTERTYPRCHRLTRLSTGLTDPFGQSLFGFPSPDDWATRAPLAGCIRAARQKHHVGINVCGNEKKKKKVWFDSWSADWRIWVGWSLYSAWCSKASTNCLSIILCYDTHNNNGKNDSMWWWILTGRCFIITISIIVIIIITTHHCYEQINSQQLINACSQFASQTATNALKRKGQFDNKRPRQLHDYIISTALMLAHLIINDDQILGFCAVNLQHSVFGLSLIAPHQKIPLQRGGGWWWGRYCV